MGFRHKSPFTALAKTGSISFDCSLVTDNSLVPIHAAGITAFLNTLEPALAWTMPPQSNSLRIPPRRSRSERDTDGVILPRQQLKDSLRDAKPTRRRRFSLNRLLSLTQLPALYETRTGVRISNWNGLRRPLHLCSIRIKGNQDRRNRHQRIENRTDTTRPGTYRISRLNTRYHTSPEKWCEGHSPRSFGDSERSEATRRKCRVYGR